MLPGFGLLQSSAGLNISQLFASTAYTDAASASQFVSTGFSPSLTWHKNRASAASHFLIDTIRGSNSLSTDSTAAQVAVTANKGNPTTGGFNKIGIGSASYIAWSFVEEPRFFRQIAFAHVNGVASLLDLSSLGAVGLATVKNYGALSDWFVWHRLLSGGNNLRLNTTAAQSITTPYISVSGTSLTFSPSAPSGNDILEAWAHETALDGVVFCGSYFGNGSSSGPSVSTGWEPQAVLVKNISAAADWVIVDSTRGFANGANERTLAPNTTAAETALADVFDPTTNGFIVRGTSASVNANSQTYVYLAIRKP